MVPSLHHRKTGFALVLVLAILAIAATVMVQIATHNLRLTQESLRAQRNLQTRWALASAEKILLPIVDDVLVKANQPIGSDQQRSGLPVASVRTIVQLDTCRLTVVLADEDAKVNLNVLRATKDHAAFLRSTQSLLGPRAATLLSMQPGVQNATFHSWGEVFDLQRLSQQEGDNRALAELTQHATLWGSGRLNIQRADSNAIIELSQTVIPAGTAQSLLQRYEESGRQLPANLLVSTGTENQPEAEQLLSVLRDQSQCFSVWMESEDLTGRRTQRLVIRQIDDEGLAQRFSFAFD